MKKLLMLFFCVFSLWNMQGQSRKKETEVDIVDHQVQLGETVRMISKKYLVDPAEIYKLNKFAVEGISEGMTLKIPVPRKEGQPKKDSEPENSNPPAPETTPSENIRSATSGTQTPNQEAVDKPSSDDGLLSSKKQEIKKIVITEKKTEIFHKVLPKETLYSLSRDFNVSVDEIKKTNPELASKGLQIGQIVKIPQGKTLYVQQSTQANEPESNTTQTSLASSVSVSETEGEVIKHKVEPKETLYSLSRKYNVSVDEIKHQNEAVLKNGLQIGQILTIKK